MFRSFRVTTFRFNCTNSMTDVSVTQQPLFFPSPFGRNPSPNIGRIKKLHRPESWRRFFLFQSSVRFHIRNVIFSAEKGQPKRHNDEVPMLKHVALLEMNQRHDLLVFGFSHIFGKSKQYSLCQCTCHWLN